MQVNNANILNPKGMLYNAVTLQRQNTTPQQWGNDGSYKSLDEW